MDSLTWCNLNFRLWCIFNFRRQITISLTGLEKSIGKPITIEIFSIKGQAIHQVEVGGISSHELVRSINLSNYPTGLYLCRVKIGERATTKKFTIIK